MTSSWLIAALVVAALVLLPRFTRWLWLRPFSLDHKVVIITGGANGIGRALAERIWTTAKDVTLVLLDVNDDALRDVKTFLEAGERTEATATSKVLTFHCNVADDAEVETCMSQVVAAVAPRHIGVLVNNAGIVNGANISELTPAQLQRLFSINVFAHFYLVRHALPSLKQSEGGAMIVSVSSLFGFLYGCKLADYCAAKAAVVSFHNCLRLELMRDGLADQIRTLLVCPLGIRTGMFDGIFEGDSGLFNLQRYLAPMLTQDEAITSIHRSILAGEQEVLSCHPGRLGTLISWLTPMMRLLPIPVQDLVAQIGGSVRGMDTFVGHQGKKA